METNSVLSVAMMVCLLSRFPQYPPWIYFLAILKFVAGKENRAAYYNTTAVFKMNMVHRYILHFKAERGRDGLT